MRHRSLPLRFFCLVCLAAMCAACSVRTWEGGMGHGADQDSARRISEEEKASKSGSASSPRRIPRKS